MRGFGNFLVAVIARLFEIGGTITICQSDSLYDPAAFQRIFQLVAQSILACPLLKPLTNHHGKIHAQHFTTTSRLHTY